LSNNEPSVPRLSARVFFNDVAGELFSLDRGVPYTLWQLLRRPGPTIRRYVELRDERLTKPFRLVLICLALAALVLSFTPLSQQFLKSAATTPTDPSDASNAFSAALTSVVPTVPRSALIPKGSRNLLVAGRCVSSDRLANSALRVQASCMGMGQAAGANAALAAEVAVALVSGSSP